HHLILGGDMLDCGPVSHHRKGKVGELEGLRLRHDADLLSSFITQLEATTTKPSGSGGGRRIYHIGNHEGWLSQLTDAIPALMEIVDIPRLLSLSPRWEVVEQGGVSRLGKLHFLHGDQINSTVSP